MRYPPHILDDIRARMPVSAVVGRKVALKKKGREWAGLSPFKVEKTPSFFVNDQKGFYHCFASGEHGDIFKFLMVTEGLTFPEAVERLAGEAGVALPKPDARDLQQEDARARLYALLEASARFFEERLAAGDGAEARRYLDRRGLLPETRREFRLGFAPASRTALKEYLGRAGYGPAEMAEAGMLISGPDIPEPYDRFRNRVMFPIQDGKGRIVAFGGRALDANAQAKYLNSPETPLFHKGYVLFNAHRARPRAHDKGRIIAVEGYMDAVSLSEAGFPEVVAPLGTALTEDQVRLLWRMAPEPLLCFDGDSAGRKAAHRAVDTALPLLEPGRSLTFAFLPDGLDPDDLVRQQGAAALEAVLAKARPLVDVLFEREWSQDTWSTPERRAGLERRLRELSAAIPDPSVRGHYEVALRDRLAAAWGAVSVSRGRNAWPPGRKPGRDSPGAFDARRPGYPGRQPSGRRTDVRDAGFIPPNPSESLRKSALVAGDGTIPSYREALLVRALLNHPWLAVEQSEEVAALPFASPAFSGLRDAIVSALTLNNALDREGLHSQLSRLGADRILSLVSRSNTHRCDKFAEPDADRAEVEDGWRHALELHDRQLGLRRSLEAAERAWLNEGSEEAFSRIREIKRELDRLGSPGALDSIESI